MRGVLSTKEKGEDNSLLTNENHRVLYKNMLENTNFQKWKVIQTIPHS